MSIRRYITPLSVTAAAFVASSPVTVAFFTYMSDTTWPQWLKAGLWAAVVIKGVVGVFVIAWAFMEAEERVLRERHGR